MECGNALMDKRPEPAYYDNWSFNRRDLLHQKPNRRRRCSLMVEIQHPHLTEVDFQQIIEAGANMVKIKNSTTTQDDRVRLLDLIAQGAKLASKKRGYDISVASCITVKSTVVTTGIIDNELGKVTLIEGATVNLTNDVSKINKCNKDIIYVDNSKLSEELSIGMEVNIDEDAVTMKCKAIVNDKLVRCTVIKGGTLRNMVKVCVRGMKCLRPNVNQHDATYINFGLLHEVDVILVHYPRRGSTIKAIKQAIKNEYIEKPFIFGAICSEEGLQNIDEIIEEIDGLVFAREYFAYEITHDLYRRLPQIQKMVIAKCLKAGKPIFLSGGIMDSVLSTGKIKQHDIVDVTNALYDGVTGFILINRQINTQIENLLEAIYFINNICTNVEPTLFNSEKFWWMVKEWKMPVNAAEAAVISCAAMATQVHAMVIIVPTTTGRTVFALARLCPCSLILAVTANTRVGKKLVMIRGVLPLIFKGEDYKGKSHVIVDKLRFGLDFAIKRKYLGLHDSYITFSRGTETSSYSDTVSNWNVKRLTGNVVDCPDPADTDGPLPHYVLRSFK